MGKAREKGWARKIRVPMENMKIMEDTDEYAGEEAEVKGRDPDSAAEGVSLWDSR